ncbi:MAG: VWA domain-containing protein, partial [Chitinispirillaceae bacterium]|nr:VWA domain-containing protein [Chitinispirillaceae bacterium]
YTYGYGSITIVFTASAANETHYFGVRTSSTSFYTDDFTIRYGSPVTLTVENDGNGATSPSGAISVAPDAPRSISASPAIGYRFNNWTVTSGNATFADPAAYSTTVTLTSNATIRANFSQGSIYPVTATDVTYNFTTHYYTGATPGTMPGVAFRFTAPSAGSYAIVVEDVEASSKYIFDYGVDSTFTSYLNYTSGSGTLTFMFTASAANEKHYFGVRPSSSSYYTNNFTIRYGTASTLTVEHSGFGTTTPSGDVALLAGASRSISATTTSSVSYFDHWELVSGNATISSPSSSSTTVTVNSGDATVRAVFLMHPVDTLIINSTNGVTFPSDTVFILTGNDTSVTATPNGGYMFTSWTVVQGNATLGNASNPLTSVQVVNGKATIRANFVVDPNARPHLSISGIDISGHPDICITASVTDTAGRSITGLDSSFFTLREDGTSLPFHLSTVTERGGTSVCLVIDKSGSMSGTPMAQAIAAAQTYINSMNPLDRCAIVAFESTASLVQGMTSDKAALNSAVSGLIGTGGTDILAGTNLGIAQLVQETNPRSVIVFSDGQGASSPPLDSVIRFARNNDVTIYSIGIGSASTSPLRELADSTGGYFVTAPTAAELAEIYDKIKRDVEARYILCYETPDTIFNGDTHTVVVSVTLNNKTSRDTTVWDESNKPPVVTLTSATQALIGNNQPDNTAITITANVTDEGTITNVRLFYRITGSGGAYTEIPMTIQSGNTYGAVIPAGSVLSPGIDFYIVATDNYNLIGRSPNVLSPETKPWVIPVYGNRLSISVISDTAVDEGSLLFIHVTATDSDGTIPAITASGLPGSATFTDSGNGAGLFSWDIGCSGHGVYSVVFKASDGIDSVQATLALTVRDSNFAPEFLSTNDTAAPENQQLTLTVRTEDCDGDVPKIKAISIPSGSAFSDNGDGTATLEWTPDCDDNGYYIVVFEAADDHTAVRDTILIRITDVNCFEPRMTLSEVELSTGVNLSVSITVHASDSDGTVPTLEANDLPSGAQFTADGDGNAVFSWTPTSIGTFTPTIVAVDAVDAAVRIDTTVTITVSDNNFTGPVFRTCLDTIIDENQLLNLVIAADDPDGTIPTLQPLSLPEEATFIDNNNGSAVIAWRPGCAMHGNHLLSATATDGTFSDTLTVLVTVRDQNCPPVINPVSDKNITYGSTIRFSVGATDPDNDIIPELSVSCALPGYTFTLDDSGSGTFEWNASYSSGSYVVTFYASDGFLADTETVTIAVDKAGSIHIVAEPSDALLFICPASGATGTFLGTGSATFTHVPGTYWFRAQTPGYRSSIFTGAVTADAACTLSVKLKTIIPLMVSPPETAQMGTADDVDLAGSIAFVDFDADGIQDLSVADGTTLRIFPGSDGEKGLRYRVPAISINVPSTLDSIVAHTYCDWNNDGAYECLLSLKGGAIHVARFDNEDLVPDDEILNCPGETLFPAVADLNADLRKDLLVVSGGKGAYLYFNNDDDEAPAFDTPVAVTGEAAETLDGNPLLWDFDGDGRSDLIAAAGDHLQFFSSSGDSTLHELPAGEDFNAGGQRIPRNGSSAALLMLSQSAPRLAVLSEGTVSVYQLRLLGDVTGDGTVNIADISKISKAWELSEKDEGWNPACNLRLSASGGGEVIDINDISRAAKNWEMQE